MPNCFPKRLLHLIFPLVMNDSFSHSTSSPMLAIFCVHLSRCKVVSYGFDLHFPNYSQCWPSHLVLIVNCMFFVQMSTEIHTFYLFYYWVVKMTFYILNACLLSIVCIIDTFFLLFCGWSFIFPINLNMYTLKEFFMFLIFFIFLWFHFHIVIIIISLFLCIAYLLWFP
jgi:hypothetical protein